MSGGDDEDGEPSPNRQGDTQQDRDEAKTYTENDPDGEFRDEKDLWRDDADSLRDDDSPHEDDDDKDELDPQELAAELARGFEEAAGRGVETAPAKERESSSICDSSQATSAHGACDAPTEVVSSSLEHVELTPEPHAVEPTNKTVDLDACDDDELAGDSILEARNTDDLAIQAGEAENEVGVLRKDSGHEARNTDDLAVKSDEAAEEVDVLADTLAEPVQVAATAAEAGRALALIDDESLVKDAGDVVVPPSVPHRARTKQESRGAVGAWESQRYEHRLLTTPASQKEPSNRPASLRGAVRHSAGRDPRRGGPSASTPAPKPVSHSKNPQFPPNTKPIKGPATPFEPARDRAPRASDSNDERGTPQSQMFMRLLQQRQSATKSPLKEVDLLRFRPFFSVKSMHPRPDTAITDFSVATVGSEDSLQPQSPLRIRRGSTLRRVEGVVGSYAIETPDNGSKHSRLTAVLQEDRDKHLPLICVTQFLSGQAAQLDTRPILVNDASAPTIPIRYDTSPSNASRAGPLVDWESEAHEAKQQALAALVQARSVSRGYGAYAGNGCAGAETHGSNAGRSTVPTQARAARRRADSRSPPTRAERSAAVLSMFPDRSCLSPSRHLEQVHAGPGRSHEEHATPRFLSQVSFSRNPEQHASASLSCSLSASRATRRASRDTNRASRGSDHSSLLATPTIAKNVWEQSFWEDNAAGLSMDCLMHVDSPVPCEADTTSRLHLHRRSYRKNKVPYNRNLDEQRHFTAPTTLCPEDGEFSISMPSWGRRRDLTSASTVGIGLSPDPYNPIPTEEQLQELKTPLRQQSLSRRMLLGPVLPDLQESVEFPSPPISSLYAAHPENEDSVEESDVYANQHETPDVLQLFQAHKLTRHRYLGADLNDIESPREKRNQYVAREVKAPSIFTGRCSSKKAYSSYGNKVSTAATPTLPRVCRSAETLPEVQTSLPMSRSERSLPVSRQGRVRAVIDRNTKLFDRIRLEHPSICLPETASKLASAWTKKQHGDLGCFWGGSESH